MENIQSTFKTKKFSEVVVLWTGNIGPKRSYVEDGPQLETLLRSD